MQTVFAVHSFLRLRFSTTMKYSIFAAAAALVGSAFGADAVVGAAEGFAKGVTGGGEFWSRYCYQN